MKNIYFLLLLSIIVISCSDKEKEAELEAKILELTTQLDDCENGSDKLLAAIEIAYKNNNNTKAKSLFKDLEDRHPESKEYNLGSKIYNKIVAEEKAIKDKLRKEKELKEREEKRKIELAKKERLKSLKKLKKDFDDVSGITWYEQPYFTHYNNKNLTSIYIGHGSSIFLRLKMSYYGDNWIFFEEAILSYDGNSKTIPFDKYKDKKTDNSSGNVWEWIDVSVDKGLENFLRKFAKSKNAKMRLSGKYTETRTLTYNERIGILDVLNGYDALTD